MGNASGATRYSRGRGRPPQEGTGRLPWTPGGPQRRRDRFRGCFSWEAEVSRGPPYPVRDNLPGASAGRRHAVRMWTWVWRGRERHGEPDASGRVERSETSPGMLIQDRRRRGTERSRRCPSREVPRWPKNNYHASEGGRGFIVNSFVENTLSLFCRSGYRGPPSDFRPSNVRSRSTIHSAPGAAVEARIRCPEPRCHGNLSSPRRARNRRREPAPRWQNTPVLPGR
jgi:hypothetical protein